MILIQEIKKALYAKFQTSTMHTVDGLQMYLDHTPNSVSYPLVTVYALSSNQTMAMPNTIKPSGFDYCDAIFDICVYGNDKNHVVVESFADQLETLYHRQLLTTGNSVTHIATISIQQRTMFYDQAQKVWSIHTHYRILAGA